MRRGVLTFDRVMAALAGLVLIGLGVLGILWWAGKLGSVPTRVDLTPIRWWPKQQWWPWALGLGGVVLVLLGLRWLFSHLPSGGVSHLSLPGSGTGGKLVVAVRPVMDAAAQSLARAPGVRSAKGRVDHDRGQLVASLDATIERGADLRIVASAADAVTGELQDALERRGMTARVRLKTAGRNRRMPRVY